MRLLDTRLPEIKLAILRDENLDEYGKARYWDFIKTEYVRAYKTQIRSVGKRRKAQEETLSAPALEQDPLPG